jgi:hypothetical protein
MTWLAWRLHRAQILVTVGVVALVATVLVTQRLSGDAVAAEHGCSTGVPGLADCGSAASGAILNQFGAYVYLINMLLLGLPVLLGLWCGAPLFARELERGTQVFALTQSISRRRWWGTKLSVVGVPLALSMLGLGMLALWAVKPFTDLMKISVLSEENYANLGSVAAVIALLFFAVGATVGIVWRNTIAVLAVTLVGTFAMVVFLTGLRADFIPTSEYRAPLSDAAMMGDTSLPAETWYVDLTYQSADGADLTHRFNGECATDVACGKKIGVATVTSSYHRPDRFWPLQLVETGIYLVIIGITLGLGAWALRRRRLG